MQRSKNFRRLGYKSRILVSLTRVFTMKHCQFTVADLGEGRGGLGPPPLFWVKKEEMTEGKISDRASKSRPTPPPPPLAQGLDPPLV